MLKTKANPGGLPMEKLDEIRLGSTVDRSQFYKDLASGGLCLTLLGSAPIKPKLLGFYITT